jgi:hypothetical protein
MLVPGTRSGGTVRRRARLVTAGLLPAVVAGAAALAQPAPSGLDVEERAVVVARDAWVAGEIGDPGELRVTVDGRPAPVVAVAGADEPVHTLVVLDAVLGDTTELRRSALLLAGLAGALTQLGPVRVVALTGRGPAEWIDWTRDAARLEDGLSRRGLTATSGEVLAGLRLPWLFPSDAPPGPEAAERAAREATLAVIRQLDRLLELAAEPTPAARRVLLLAGAGFDPCPAAFFGVAEVAPDATGCHPSPDVGDRDPGAELGPSLATLGWTVAAIAPPDPGDPRAWKFGMLDQIAPDAPMVFGLTVKINQERKPKRARLYLEQARGHLAAGELDAAEEDGRKAVHHFARGRKTRAEEAAAWRLVADVHARRSEASSAGRALLRARLLDPAPRGDETGAAIERLARSYAASRGPLERVATATAGVAAYGADQLEKGLAEIGRRRRVTYQLPVPAAERPGALEVRATGGLLDAAPWASPSPTALHSLARARRLLRAAADAARDAGERPGLGIWAPASAKADGALALQVELSAIAPAERRWTTGPWRVTVLHSELEAEQHHTGAPAADPSSGRLALEVELERPDLAIALILVEDLGSGAWGFAAGPPGPER